MAKNQTRKSISVSGDSYWALRAWCDEREISMSSVVEGYIVGLLGGKTVPVTKAVKKVAAPVKVKAAPVKPVTPRLTDADWRKSTASSRLDEIRALSEKSKSRSLTSVDAASKIFTF